jgi:DNA-binding NtrC family response regulator
LPDLIQKGLFREDLYFRLNVIAIEIPPLRERENDILLLAHHFAVKFAQELDKPTPRFSDSVLRAFKQYPWPGNVRELENIVQRLVVLHEGPHIDISDLPAYMRYSGLSGKNFSRTLAAVEMEYIRNVLESVDNNKTQAAKILGIDRKTLREKLDSPE